ncbi:T-cell surface glycoprotein CD3 gamma chain-like [Sphaerodactylus townsendi]|uniref:T-cell surface glycoprotein CD3 gamma chain-like n=1 Tax=Sphaerodactylus townsendi TaxID=933632 RepID=UPI00202719FA|nr:T-cell surface glycoprotein CD3 gamma chain-like [Sphaerodactylus townsendi]
MWVGLPYTQLDSLHIWEAPWATEPTEKENSRRGLDGLQDHRMLKTGIVVTGNSDQGVSIQVKHKRNGIYLFCRTGKDSKVLNWTKDGKDIGSANEKELLVGSAVDDPRGLYQCNSEKANGSLQLYFRMCQYCVQLNSAVVIGMVAAEVVATALLVAAVWCLAAQEPGRRSRASPARSLLCPLQPLGERNNGQYSHIGVAKARRR